jgi:predicted ATPase
VIKTISLQNFKSWHDSGPVEFGNITAFFGANSSGKTSLLQSLLLLKQTTESADRGRVFDMGGPSTPVDLGTFRDILYRHDPEARLQISISWQENEPIEIRNTEVKTDPPIARSRDLSLRVAVSDRQLSPVVEELEYELGDMSFILARRAQRNEYNLSSKQYQFKRTLGRKWPIPAPGKFYSFPDEVRGYFQNAAFLSDLELQFEKMCSEIYYLGPLRAYPERQYTWSGGRPVDVGRRGELAVEALIASSRQGQTNSRGFARIKSGIRRLRRITVEEHVALWLKELGLIHSFELRPLDDRNTIYRVLVKRTPTSSPVLITDVGFGVGQVLPVLTLLAYVPEGSVVLLEQPEIHLHPMVQAGLADAIVEAAKARNLQVVLESHSEHLLQRLQRRLAERELAHGIVLEPEDCRFYFTNFEGGASHIDRLSIDLFGNIENWPKDFFGAPLKEIAAMSRAERSRKLRERSA